MNLQEKKVRPGTNDSFIIKQFYNTYKITSRNRYKHSNLLLLADDKLIPATLNQWDMLIVPKNSNSFVVTAAEENRIDLIATKVYGSAGLYWVICYANNIADPLTEITVGRLLTIPDLASLFTYPNPLA